MPGAVPSLSSLTSVDFLDLEAKAADGFLFDGRWPLQTRPSWRAHRTSRPLPLPGGPHSLLFQGRDARAGPPKPVPLCTDLLKDFVVALRLKSETAAPT